MEMAIYNREHSKYELLSSRKDIGRILEISAENPVDDHHLFGSKP